LIIIMTYLLACNLVVQHIISCNWVLPVGNIFIIIIIIIIITALVSLRNAFLFRSKQTKFIERQQYKRKARYLL
jgi:hypothetical protein